MPMGRIKNDVIPVSLISPRRYSSTEIAPASPKWIRGIGSSTGRQMFVFSDDAAASHAAAMNRPRHDAISATARDKGYRLYQPLMRPHSLRRSAFCPHIRRAALPRFLTKFIPFDAHGARSSTTVFRKTEPLQLWSEGSVSNCFVYPFMSLPRRLILKRRERFHSLYTRNIYIVVSAATRAAVAAHFT